MPTEDSNTTTITDVVIGEEVMPMRRGIRYIHGVNIESVEVVAVNIRGSRRH